MLYTFLVGLLLRILTRLLKSWYFFHRIKVNNHIKWRKKASTTLNEETQSFSVLSKSIFLDKDTSSPKFNKNVFLIANIRVSKTVQDISKLK